MWSEISFFHKIINVKLEDNKNYIDEWINLFENNDDLSKCQ